MGSIYMGSEKGSLRALYKGLYKAAWGSGIDSGLGFRARTLNLPRPHEQEESSLAQKMKQCFHVPVQV